ncbi:hypothetical protein [Rhizobium leguminosarum]|uniref:hypothetical protein n=1 Tax=Rhizobium leguminosarum TaxID=384 RepID=UPI001030E8AF|nr:hypothetical protein [Rhizobium leguminosarum]TAX39140.1 hypothetical protein ELI05_09345 [Rhizobium leguminosarum]
MPQIPYDKDNAERFLAAAIIAHYSALKEALTACAKAKGVNDLSWFDEIHHKALSEAKGTVTEQIPIDVEAKALKFGVDVIDAAFNSIRYDISK